MIIDVHVHSPTREGTVSQWHKIIPSTEEFLRYLKKCCIDKAIISSCRGISARKNGDIKITNEETLELSQKYPETFIPACQVNPNFLDESLTEMGQCRNEYKMVWLGELCPYRSAGNFEVDTPEFRKILSKACDLDMIVQLHTSHTHIGNFAKEFPDITFVLAHPGESRLDCQDRINTIAENKNIYMDIAAAGSERLGILELAVEKIGDDRILFGSDYTINDPGMVVARIQNASFSKETKNKIFYKNILTLLKSKGYKL